MRHTAMLGIALHVMTIHRVSPHIVVTHLVVSHALVVAHVTVPHMMITHVTTTHLVMRHAPLMPLGKMRLAPVMALLAPFAFAREPLCAALEPGLTLVGVVVPVVDAAAGRWIEICCAGCAERRAECQQGRKNSQRKSTLHT